jgi:PhnB protein
MKTELNPYFSFKDNTREAMEFYKSVFGGTLTVSTFKDFHASTDPREDSLVMHSVLKADNGIAFMASDTPARLEYRPDSNGSVALSGDDDAELKNYFQKLSSGGTITQPLVKATWGDSFGMCKDKFGITWMVNISAPKS